MIDNATPVKPYNPFLHNYTTTDQVGVLLEMGVPKESADCYYYFGEIRLRMNKEELSSDFFDKNKLAIPCWSVGQLINVFIKCAVWDDEDDVPSLHINAETPSLWNGVDTIIEAFKDEIESDNMDFTEWPSKALLDVCHHIYGQTLASEIEPTAKEDIPKKIGELLSRALNRTVTVTGNGLDGQDMIVNVSK